jgi:F-type H+-transporting ATPase subunit delta
LTIFRFWKVANDFILEVYHFNTRIVNQSLIAIRYAKALFKLVKDKGVLLQVNNDLTLIGRVIKESKDLDAFLNNPMFKVSGKKEIVKTLFGSKCQAVTIDFFNLVIDMRREDLLPAIIRNYGDLVRSELGIKRVVYTSATPLSVEFERTLKDQLENLLVSKIELSIGVKPELIGGFVLLVDGKQADMSVLNRLKQMEKQLLAAI